MPPNDPWQGGPTGPPEPGPVPGPPQGAMPPRPAAGAAADATSPPPPPPPAPSLGWEGLHPPPPGAPVRVAREHGVADIIDLTFGMLRSAAKPIMGLSVLLGLPGIVVSGLFFALSTWTPSDLGAVEPFWVVVGVVGILAFVVGAAATEPAIIHVALSRGRGERPSMAAAAWAGIRRVPGLVSVWFVLVLASVVPVVLGIGLLAVDTTWGLSLIVLVPLTIGLFLVAQMTGHLVTAAVVAESRGAWRSLGRVRQLLRGQFWRTFGRGLLFGFMIQVIGSVVQFGGFVGLAFGDAGALVGQVISQLVQYMVVVPLSGLAALGLYADLRLRAEGVDELALL